MTTLLAAGADLEVRVLGKTPLHEAAFSGDAEVVTALLAAGADTAAQGPGRKLPIDYAEDNEKLRGTDAYWKLNDARYQ